MGICPEGETEFDLVVLNRPVVYGPLKHTIRNVSELNESNGRI